MTLLEKILDHFWPRSWGLSPGRVRIAEVLLDPEANRRATKNLIAWAQAVHKLNGFR